MLLTELDRSAANLLEQFATQLAAIDGFDLPETQYVVPANAPWDGPALAVELGPIVQGQPGMPIATGFIVAQVSNFTATFYVQLLREVPGLSVQGQIIEMIPDSDVMFAAGEAYMRDSSALIQAAIAVHAAFTATSPGEGFVIGPLVPLGPFGGLVGQRLSLEFSLS